MEKTEYIDKIKSVLETGQKWNDEDAYIPAGLAIQWVLEIPGTEVYHKEKTNEGFETNGWAYDWWQYFLYKGESYVLGEHYALSGSGYDPGLSFERK